VIGRSHCVVVSQYLLDLPKKEAMQEFIERQLAELKSDR
jgi:hypothetical protein